MDSIIEILYYNTVEELDEQHLRFQAKNIGR